MCPGYFGRDGRRHRTQALLQAGFSPRGPNANTRGFADRSYPTNQPFFQPLFGCSSPGAVSRGTATPTALATVPASSSTALSSPQRSRANDELRELLRLFQGSKITHILDLVGCKLARMSAVSMVLLPTRPGREGRVHETCTIPRSAAF